MIIKRNIPNLLSILRITLSPFIFFTIINESYSIALFMFCIGAISDFLDGYIARSFRLVSKIGKYIDPIADKVFIISAFFALSIVTEYVYLWMIYLILFRDILVTFIRYFLKNKDMQYEADFFGKGKTALQVFVVLAVILILKLYPSFGYLIEYLMVVCVLITCVSGVNYLYSYINLLVYEK